MVWFQCEDCGDNLKKPKLASHFRSCSANKLSCIDCGQMFGQQTVQGHTQCMTEMEKYGPKGQAKTTNGTPGKPNSNSKPKPEVDINVGLSERPPWFCSLCNTSATSKQTLLLHADGKKHRAKARAFHASKQPPKDSDGPTPNTETKSENIQKADLPLSEGVKKESPSHTSESKKRKLEESENNGELIHDSNAESEKTKKSKGDKDVEKKIKWKKIITAVLKSNSDGKLKMRKLRTQVLQTIRESGSTIDESQLVDTLEHKINSSSKFAVNGKYVQLVSKS
ncbi:putative transcription factor C2H2 family [Helianthus annuus]|uniref:Putative zinc ion binding protein n=1 Tax=Helianthus annuus TaxID=4232 RepID=A0A251SXY3_HELAN|nr:UBP1-associated proteins 1C [Helianthus annuus]KAF5776178.1 putative transcription factor C2H2 family [Helianthus annuus]KAJ0503734.1 putative transcription factor C2H2 family [Helianthus annuus]